MTCYPDRGDRTPGLTLDKGMDDISIWTKVFVEEELIQKGEY